MNQSEVLIAIGLALLTGLFVATLRPALAHLGWHPPSFFGTASAREAVVNDTMSREGDKDKRKNKEEDKEEEKGKERVKEKGKEYEVRFRLIPGVYLYFFGVYLDNEGLLQSLDTKGRQRTSWCYKTFFRWPAESRRQRRTFRQMSDVLGHFREHNLPYPACYLVLDRFEPIRKRCGAVSVFLSSTSALSHTCWQSLQKYVKTAHHDAHFAFWREFPRD